MYQKSKKQGKEAESKFLLLMKSYGRDLKKSSRLDDINKHFDFIDKTNGNTFEVKSRKRVSRGNNKFDDTIVFIEFKNVQGKLGWLYGEADYVAFERKGGFTVVKRTELVELSEDLITKEFTTKPKPYRRYKRESRPNEETGLLLYEDLLLISSWYFKFDYRATGND